MKILISTENVHRDEINELKEYLGNNYWSSTELTQSELSGIVQMITYCIGQRINDSASDLSYMELLELRNKLRYV